MKGKRPTHRIFSLGLLHFGGIRASHETSRVVGGRSAKPSVAMGRRSIKLYLLYAACKSTNLAPTKTRIGRHNYLFRAGPHVHGGYGDEASTLRRHSSETAVQ